MRDDLDASESLDSGGEAAATQKKVLLDTDGGIGQGLKQQNTLKFTYNKNTKDIIYEEFRSDSDQGAETANQQAGQQAATVTKALGTTKSLPQGGQDESGDQ